MELRKELGHHDDVFLAAGPTFRYVDDDGKASWTVLDDLVHIIFSRCYAYPNSISCRIFISTFFLCCLFCATAGLT